MLDVDRIVEKIRTGPRFRRDFGSVVPPLLKGCLPLQLIGERGDLRIQRGWLVAILLRIAGGFANSIPETGWRRNHHQRHMASGRASSSVSIRVPHAGQWPPRITRYLLMPPELNAAH